MAKSTTIGRLTAKISADAKPFNKGMKSAKDSAKKFNKGIGKLKTGLAVLSVGGLAAATLAIRKLANVTAEAFDRLDVLAKTSRKLNIATEALAGMELAASQTGVSVTVLFKAMQKMVAGIGDAARGIGTAKDAISDMGLSIDNLLDLSPDQQFRRIAAGMKTLGTSTERVAAATALFGARGAGLLNTLALSNEEFAKFNELAGKVGAAFSEQELAKVEAANDAMDILKRTVTGLKDAFAVQLAPAIGDTAEALTEFLQKGNINKLADDFAQKMLKSFGGVADGLQALVITFKLAELAVVDFLGISSDLVRFTTLGGTSAAAKQFGEEAAVRREGILKFLDRQFSLPPLSERLTTRLKRSEFMRNFDADPSNPLVRNLGPVPVFDNDDKAIQEESLREQQRASDALEQIRDLLSQQQGFGDNEGTLPP